MLIVQRLDGMAGILSGLLRTARLLHLPHKSFDKPLRLYETDTELFLPKSGATSSMREGLTKALNKIIEKGVVSAILREYFYNGDTGRIFVLLNQIVFNNHIFIPFTCFSELR